jgi:hypothetical protein
MRSAAIDGVSLRIAPPPTLAGLGRSDRHRHPIDTCQQDS